MRHLNKYFPYQKQLKNRSSKHLNWLVGKENRPAYLSWSRDQLKEAAAAAGEGGAIYEAELSRRAARAARRAQKKAANGN